MKKLLSVLLALVLFVGCFSLFAGAEETEGFTPVLRFVLASDTHIRENEVSNVERIRKMMALAYDLADSDPTYKTVDALLLAGDLTDDGTKPEFDLFGETVRGALRDGTRFLGVVAKNHDGYEMPRAEMRGYYADVSGNDADFHVVIGGAHFIGVSASPKKSARYDAAQLKWLKAQLDAAVAEDPQKPVFVMHHEPVRGTVYGSSFYDGWGITNFTSLFKNYPQIVDFAGHSHYPLNDPRSIWQGAFTAVGTGAIYYSEFTVAGLRAYHPADSGNTASCWIVEMNKEYDLRLRGFDVNAQKQLCEAVLKNPADPENRDYTPEKRKASASAPVFGADAALKVTPEFGGCTVIAPQAASADGQPVTLYRARALKANGRTAAKTWTLPPYYRDVDGEEIALSFAGLAKGEYTVRVVAENAYGMQSAPIEAQVTIEGETGLQAFFARIKVWFAGVKNYFRQLFW